MKAFVNYEGIAKFVGANADKVTKLDLNPMSKTIRTEAAYSDRKTAEAALLAAAERYYIALHPTSDAPTTAVTPNGKIFVGTEAGPCYWLTEFQLYRNQCKEFQDIVSKLGYVAEAVPENIRTHRWYKEFTDLIEKAELLGL